MTVNRSVVGEENDTTENTDQNERVAVNYGLDLAARTNFPAKYVEKAKQIAETITKNDSNIVEVNQLDHLCNQTIISLKKLGKSGLKDGELTEELRRLKSLFLETSSELPEVVAKRVNKDTSQQDFENKLNKEKVDNSESLDYSIDCGWLGLSCKGEHQFGCDAHKYTARHCKEHCCGMQEAYCITSMIYQYVQCMTARHCEPDEASIEASKNAQEMRMETQNTSHR